MNNIKYIIFLLVILSCNKKSGGGEHYVYPCSTSDDGIVKRMLIIGDSISLGYSPHVIKSLCSKGIFVTRILVNGRGTQFTLANLDRWVGDKHWDLITFNEGIWNLPSANRTNEQLRNTLIDYGQDLGAIANKILRQTDRAIFFTTTHIGLQNRFLASDVIFLNHTARVALRGKSHLSIADLYRDSLGVVDHHQADQIHFDTVGSAVLAEFVGSRAENALK